MWLSYWLKWFVKAYLWDTDGTVDFTITTRGFSVWNGSDMEMTSKIYAAYR